jgi:hypothetical protein
MAEHDAGQASLAPDQLAQLWAEHLRGEFQTKDVEETLATMVEDASVTHVPVGTGGQGKDALRAFYRDDFIPSWPGDLQMTPVNRVIGEGQLVDELHVTFTHSKPMPWFLPNTPPRTNRSTLISWWSCNFAGINWPVSASTGTTPLCYGKSGSFGRSGERAGGSVLDWWANRATTSYTLARS